MVGLDSSTTTLRGALDWYTGVRTGLALPTSGLDAILPKEMILKGAAKKYASFLVEEGYYEWITSCATGTVA